MIYGKFNKGKFGIFVKVLSLILAVSFAASMYSCTTTEICNYRTEEFLEQKRGRTDELVRITTTDSVFDVKDTKVEYSSGLDDYPGVLSFDKYDTVRIEAGKGLRLRVTPYTVLLKDVTNLKYSETRIDAGKTIAYSAITIGALIVIGIALLLMFPPKISIFGDHKHFFQTGH